MKAFVTGGTGFVGSHLVDALQSAGHDVVCLVRTPTKAQTRFGKTLPAIVAGDLLNREALTRGCEGCDVVFHLAGLTAARSVDELFSINQGATETLVAVAGAAGTVRRFVHVSTLAAAGPAARGRPLTEDLPAAPVSNYGRSKLAGEQAVRAGPLAWTIVRPPAVYGPRDAEILRMFKLLRWHLAPLIMPGRQELSFIHVSDLAQALVAATHDVTSNKLYYVTHPAVVTARQFVQDVHATLHGPSKTRGPVILPFPHWMTRLAMGTAHVAAKAVGRATLLSPDKAREFKQEAWTCSSAAFERDTGWHATIDLKTGLEQTVRWYREAGWL